MTQLTIDTCVLLCGTGMSSNGDCASAVQLLEIINDRSTTAVLVLDDGDKIRAEYERKMGASSPGRIWLTHLLLSPNHLIITSDRLDRGTRVQLQEAHFDPDDFAFVAVAASTDSKILVSEDDDYSAAVCRILRRRKSVSVKKPSEACDLCS